MNEPNVRIGQIAVKSVIRKSGLKLDSEGQRSDARRIGIRHFFTADDLQMIDRRSLSRLRTGGDAV